MNRDWINQLATQFGSAIALEELASGMRISYKELPTIVKKRAECLQGSGIFGTCLPTDLNHALWLLAAGSVSRPICPLSLRWPIEKTRALAADQGVEEWVTAQGLKSIAGRTFAHALGAGTLLCTSGSSGHPKAVFHSWDAHIASAEGGAVRIPLYPGHRWHQNLPLWHVSGLGALFRTLHHGATAVFGTGQAITHRSVVSTQLHRMLDQGVSWEGMLAVMAGGGPIAPALRNRAIQAGVPLHVTYGMTETASQVCTSVRLSMGDTQPHSGEMLPHREVRLDAKGEIEIRGAVLLDGYLLPDGTLDAARTPDGWFRAADVGAWTARGELVILGRRDRMFISGGENIHPEKIEAAVGRLAGVQRSVVVGQENEEFGMRPIVFVEGEIPNKAAQESLREELAGFEMPILWLPWPAGNAFTSDKIPWKNFRSFTVDG